MQALALALTGLTLSEQEGAWSHHPGHPGLRYFWAFGTSPMVRKGCVGMSRAIVGPTPLHERERLGMALWEAGLHCASRGFLAALRSSALALPSPLVPAFVRRCSALGNADISFQLGLSPFSYHNSDHPFWLRCNSTTDRLMLYVFKGVPSFLSQDL